MSQSTITLSDDVTQAVDDLARQEGIAADQLIENAVKQHVFCGDSVRCTIAWPPRHNNRES